MRPLSHRFLVLGSQILVVLAGYVVPVTRVNAAPAALTATSASVEAETEHVATLTVEFDAKPEFTATLSHNRTRLTIDVAGSGVGGAPASLTPESGPIGGVMIQGFAGERPVTRIIVTLRQAAEYAVSVVGNDLVVAIGKSSVRAPTPLGANP